MDIKKELSILASVKIATHIMVHPGDADLLKAVLMRLGPIASHLLEPGAIIFDENCSRKGLALVYLDESGSPTLVVPKGMAPIPMPSPPTPPMPSNIHNN